jgi:hypothetical protein
MTRRCAANIKAEFECANFLSAGSKKVQIVGFGGVAQVRDGVDKQVQIFKTVASKPSFLAQQETMVDQTSSTVIDRLKTKISNMPPSSSFVTGGRPSSAPGHGTMVRIPKLFLIYRNHYVGAPYCTSQNSVRTDFLAVLPSR